MKDTRIIKPVFIPSVIITIASVIFGSMIFGIIGFLGVIAGIETKDANGVYW